MKFIIRTAFIALLALPVLNAQDAPKDQTEKVSYGIGLSIGSKIKKDGLDLNQGMFSKGINDGLTGVKPLMTEVELQQTMQAFQAEMQAKMAQKQKDAAMKNKADGDAFLAANKDKEGVKTLPSGLQYKMITEGKGAKPKSTDTVSVNYRGTLIDGTEFDSSYKRNEPVSFPLDKVIPGWTEGIQLLPVGSKAQFFIPSNLAYGESAPPQIGPNATLIFEVELIEIKKPSDSGASAATPTPAAKKKKN